MIPALKPMLPAPPAQDCLLYGARVAIDPSHSVRAALWLRGGRIHEIFPSAGSVSNPGPDLPQNASATTRMVRLDGHMILPGLINVHDHLRFDPISRLGHGPYKSWREWASDIHLPSAAEPRLPVDPACDGIPWWGIVRNLLSGVTTVCHHGATDWLTGGIKLPITVHSRFGWAHSVDDARWKERYAATPDEWPFMLHCAEGLDTRSRREVTKFRRSARLDHRAVLVHAVGISKRDWTALRPAGAWIVWCPTSDLHILGRTIPRDLVLTYPSIALGSESPASAAGDLLDELRAARALYDIPPELLYRMVTTRAARLLRLPAPFGAIAIGGKADLLIVRDSGRTPCEILADLPRNRMTAVMHDGEFVVVSNELFACMDARLTSHLHSCRHHGLEWHVAAPTAREAPPAQQLAGAAPVELNNQ
jgi:cytosine/adenosine deaminase-related metal-dependent hydrolase